MPLHHRLDVKWRITVSAGSEFKANKVYQRLFEAAGVSARPVEPLETGNPGERGMTFWSEVRLTGDDPLAQWLRMVRGISTTWLLGLGEWILTDGREQCEGSTVPISSIITVPGATWVAWSIAIRTEDSTTN